MNIYFIWNIFFTYNRDRVCIYKGKSEDEK